MKRAYSQITLKSVDDDKRILTGVATTPATDRVGDIVEPKGAEFQLPIPMLWQHDATQPIGHVTKAKVTPKGIEVEVQIAKVSEPGRLKDRLDEAWQSIKAGLVRGLSIGFKELEAARIETGLRFLRWSWLELSAVTIPANQEASITAIKSFDDELLAASGRKQSVTSRPGVSGNQQLPKGREMKTLSELLEARSAKAARVTELLETKKAEDRAFSDDEAAEFDALTDEVKQLDDEIRQARWNAINAASAKAVDGKSTKAASSSRGHIIVKSEDQEEKFEGQNFVRRIIARAIARMDDVSPIAVAEQRGWHKTNPTLYRLIKSEVAGGGTGSGEWGAELVQADTRYTGDFITFLQGKTLFDQLPFVEVPPNVAIKGQDGAAGAAWVGESKGIPVTKADFSTVSLTPLKVAAVAVVSNELLRYSSPAAEALVRNALVEAAAERVDTTLFSTAAAVTGVSPAGLLNGVSAVPASASTADGLRADVLSLYNIFIAAKNSDGLAWCMNPAMTKAISLMVNSLGVREFPDINQSGGTLLGDRVYTGHNLLAGNLVLLRPADIYKIGDGGIQVSISREATIEMTDAPTTDSDTPTAMGSHAVPMFQTESTAIKVVRPINFAKRRTHAVQYISDAEYGGVVS